MIIFDNANITILFKTAQNLGLKTKVLKYDPPKIEVSNSQKKHIFQKRSLNINTLKKAKALSKNKSLTLKTLKKAGLPVPKHTTITHPQDYPKTLQLIPFPQVIKPSTGEKGKQIYLNINSLTAGQKAANQVLSHYPEAMIETYHLGKDYRFLVFNQKLIGLSQRLSPTITGDGISTIKTLIQKENQRRFLLNQKAGYRVLNRMRNWPRISHYLHLQGLSLKAILPQGKTIILYPIPNFSTGGSVTAIDLKTIHPSFITLSKKIAQIINLKIIGIDMLIKNLKNPAVSDNVTIIETNSDPGLRLHDWPNQGQPQNVTQHILTSIFKKL